MCLGISWPVKPSVSILTAAAAEAATKGPCLCKDRLRRERESEARRVAPSACWWQQNSSIVYDPRWCLRPQCPGLRKVLLKIFPPLGPPWHANVPQCNSPPKSLFPHSSGEWKGAVCWQQTLIRDHSGSLSPPWRQMCIVRSPLCQELNNCSSSLNSTQNYGTLDMSFHPFERQVAPVKEK